MDATSARHSKWSDEQFLDTLRDTSDELANACARDLPPDQSLAYLFTKMRTDADLPPTAEFPAAFRTFLQGARASLDVDDLSEADLARLRRGQQVFMQHALVSSLVLLSKSLQEGYQAPRLGKVLMMTGELDSATYRRVLGVLQMLLTVATPGSFDPRLKSDLLPSSDSGLQAVKVRLMHAGLRGIARQKFPTFARQFGGVPISMEDMLATLIAFSWLVIEGFERLHVTLPAQDAEDYHFVWRTYARMMGIHPPGKPKSFEWIPATLAEAREFYETYKRRHYREAEENEEGVMLAASNLKMLARRMPPFAARIYMRRLIGDEASRRLRIRGVPLMFIWKALLLNFPRAWVWMWRILDRRQGGVERHNQLTQTILQRLVLVQYNAGIPSYRVPRDLEEAQEIVKGTQPGFNFGREQFMREVFPKELGDIAARRAAVGLEMPDLHGKPSVRRGLVGLCLSGGGIRSATFALGAVQALARQGCLKMVDYLSTVSGGGYTGSMLSSVLNAPDSGLEGRGFPLDYQTGQVEPPAMRHVRSGSNYLTGGGLLNEVRLPMIVIRGLLLNTVLGLPYIMLAAALTAIAYPFLHEANTRALVVAVAILLFLATMWSYPALMWLLERAWAMTWPFPAAFRRMVRQWSWDQRNLIENVQSLTLLLLGFAVALALLAEPIGFVIESGAATAYESVKEDILSSAEGGGMWKWALVLVGIVAYALVRVGKVAEALRKRTNQVLLFLLGLTAPATVFLAYLVMLLFVARSPFVSEPAADATLGSLMGAETGDGIDLDSATTLLIGKMLAGDTAALQLYSARVEHGTFLADEGALNELGDRGVTAAHWAWPVWIRLRPQTDSFARIDVVPIEPGAGLPEELADQRRLARTIDSLTADLIPGESRPAAARQLDYVDSVLADPATPAYAIRYKQPREQSTMMRLAGAHELTGLRLEGIGFGSQAFDWWFVLTGILLFALNAIWVDVNITSPHTFWRDRLSRVFLFRARWFGRPSPNDEFKLSEMGTANPAVPYHIINTSLNLAGSRVEDLPGRGSDFFMFSRRYCGSYATGYCTTPKMEEADNHIDVATAFSISAAATAPNAGTVTVRPLVFMLTLLNIRLDYWAPNPWYVQASSRVRRLVARVYRPGPEYLIREALGKLHARGAFVNLSDGGHIENLAVYELLRRRCKVIVCADAEQDPQMSCASLAKLIRYARIDLGIEINIDLNPLHLDDTTRMTHRHWTLGTIHYGSGEIGHLLYVKSSVTGDEAPYVMDYRKRNPDFPQESTADQFFDEAQFESYRALGYHAMNGALKAAATLDVGDGQHASVEGLREVRDGLGLSAPRTTSQREALA